MLADAPAYLLLPALQEIFENPDKAERRGKFRYINAESLDLPPPRDPPNASASSLWISALPPPIDYLFKHQFNEFFVKPLDFYVKTGRQARTIPSPKTYASHLQYRQLIGKAEQSGMLRWSAVSDENPNYTQLADTICMTVAFRRHPDGLP